MDGSLQFPVATPPAPGETVPIAPGIHWLRMRLPFALNHINLWLLEDGPGWTIVDCGYALDESRDAWQRIFAECLDGRPVRRVIVTHYHPDHLRGAAAFTPPIYALSAVASKIEAVEDRVAREEHEKHGGAVPDHAERPNRNRDLGNDVSASVYQFRIASESAD